MNTTNETTVSSKALLGLLLAPIAVLLAMLTDQIGGFGLGFENDLYPLLIVAAGAMLGRVPSLLAEREVIPASTSTLSLGTIVAGAALGLVALPAAGVGALVGLLFAVNLVGAHVLMTSERAEWATVLVFSSVGLLLGLIAAATTGSSGLVTTEYTFEGQTAPTLNEYREALGFVFFNVWIMFTVLGALVAVLARGVLSEPGEGWFGHLSDFDGPWDRNSLPLQLGLLTWVAAHALALVQFHRVELHDRLALSGVEGYHGHFSVWAAVLTGIVALAVASMVAERWLTRAMTLASMWVLYLVSAAFEMGMWTNDNFDGSWGAVVWFGTTFFIGVAIYSIATHKSWGGWSNRSDDAPSGARTFWSAHWSQVMIAAAFLMAFVIRSQWYIIPAMNGYGTGDWDLTGGSDPWYMKRVVDYIMVQNAHLVFDADRFYPLGGINPRPPLFVWSIALLAMILEPFLTTPEDAVWWAMVSIPAIFGALTVFPVAAIARDHVSKPAAVVAAWLIAMMPGHISRSTWANADHDAFVMFFMALGFMWFLRAMAAGGDERLTRSTDARPYSVLRAFGDVATHRRFAVANAALAGVAFGVVALGWKGFVVAPSILFVGYVYIVATNMFRNKDSTTLNMLMLTMLGTTLLLSMPFYAYPGMDLVFSGTGLQPLLFVLGFTVAIAYVTTGFRDKPWLLVLGSLTGAAVVFVAVIWLLQFFEQSNAFNVLFTGAGYFTKTKIFGTVAEANAPDRGLLFASFGPIVFILALSMGIIALWRGTRQRRHEHIFMATWILLAIFMSWTAARFIFNATPAMAVLGAWGAVGLWGWSGTKEMSRKMRRHGVRTPADRIAATRKAVWRTPQFSAIMLVMIMLGGQHMTYGLDAGIPGSSPAEDDIDETLYNVIPDILRWDQLAGFSVLNPTNYEDGGMRYLGSFGSSFNQQGWNDAYAWLAAQDSNDSYSEKPAFVSWWDYGFQALTSGDHPSVSDNFQSGIPATGNMLLARGEADLAAMWFWQLAEGDRMYAADRGYETIFTPSFDAVLKAHLSDAQYDALLDINDGTELTEATRVIDGEEKEISLPVEVLDASFRVIQTNRDTVMTQGYKLNDDGTTSSDERWRLWKDGAILACVESLASGCDGSDFTSQEDANRSFNNNVRLTTDTQFEVTHYVFGAYWYTADLAEEFNSVSTHIHRSNARLAMTVQLLVNGLEEAEVMDLYTGVIGLEKAYTVQDYNGAPGETVDRDHEIRYFAVDNRLYPRAGRYTADAQYNSGQPMGIFAAPTILSGQDPTTFLTEVYETQRGAFSDEMTREEVDEAIRQDVLNQQAGAEIDPVQIVDVRADHTAQFFDTMVARTYVGYGASTLGVDSDGVNPQPAQHFGQSGSPGTFLSQALPLPGAMMNHFVLANYNDDITEANSYGQANSMVKILKFYPGAEMTGQVTFADDGQPLENVRLLIERDAFSGESGEDLDADTYWIPIGFVDTDDEGRYSFLAPAGHIRVSAFIGEYEPTGARNSIQDGSFTENLGDILTEYNDDRTVNEITAVLGQVANMTWVGESHLNVSGDEANRVVALDRAADVSVASSGVSGVVTWIGDESFAGEPLVDTTFILRDIWSYTDNHTVVTNNGSFTSDETRILQGTGEVTFTENGTFQSDGVAVARGFTGTYTRQLTGDRIHTANGTWTGRGIIDGWVSEADLANASDCLDNNTATPANASVCMLTGPENATKYLFEGTVEASGRVETLSPTVVVRDVVGQTFEGAGVFEGTGTLNGTGLFTGQGDFSGPMVQPGSFYKTGLMPGVYNMIGVLPNGREVLLPDPVRVGVEASYDLAMTMPGAVFADVLEDMDGNMLPDTTIELVDTVLGLDHAVTIVTDENGSFSQGPIPSGEYFYRVDVDNDGWYEINETFTVQDEPVNITLAYPLPPMTDLTVQLEAPFGNDGQPTVDVVGRTVTFINDAPELDPYVVVSDENGVVYVELPMGAYTVSDDADEDHLLLARIEVGEEDISTTMTYAASTWLNGTVASPLLLENYEAWLNDTGRESEPVTQLEVVATGLDDLTFSATTNDTGHFSMRVPIGNTYSVTMVKNTIDYGNGSLVTVTEGMEDLSIVLEPTEMISGTLFHIDNSTTWNSEIPGWMPVEMTAMSSDGVVWQASSNQDGGFLFNLPAGIYDISVVEDEMYNATSDDDVLVVRNPVEMPEPASLYLNPGGHAMTFQVFQDVAGDGNVSNGSMVTPAFALVPTTVHGERLNVTSDMYAANGSLTVEMPIGSYVIEFADQDASSENASDYALVPVSPLAAIVIGIPEPIEAIDVALVDDWRMTGSLVDANGTALQPQGDSVLLVSSDGTDYRNVAVDQNGTFADYVPSGDWIAVVGAFDGEDGTEILRHALAVNENSARIDLALATVDAADVHLHLREALSEKNLSGFRMTLVSADGLGNVSLDLTDDEGHVSEPMMPGTWSVHMEREDAQDRWTLDTSSSPFTASSGASVNVTDLFADHEVEIGGRLYWDLDADDSPDADEGVAGVVVNVTSLDGTTFAANVTSNDDGVWELFVPVRTSYIVEGSKEGFANMAYDLDGNGSYVVNDSAMSEDLEVSVGLVDVSGAITDDVDATRLDGASVVLHPASGLARDSITVTSTSFDGTTLTWDAQVEPGAWVVVVQQANLGENDGAVAIDLLDASVGSGGHINQTMAIGGFIDLQTAWTGIDLVQYHLGSASDGASMISEGPTVTVDLDEDISWDVTLDADGGLSLLVPSGRVSFAADMVTVQHALALNMSYEGSTFTNVAADRQELTLTLDRRADRDLIVEVGTVDDLTVDSFTNDESGVDILAKQDGEYEHTSVEFTVDVTYDGTEFEEVYTASGNAGNAPDAADWSVEFWNSTSEVWQPTLELRLGIGENASTDDVPMTATLNVRVNLPDQNTSLALQNGHSVNVLLAAETGEFTERSVTVRVPVIRGFELEADDAQVGIGSGDAQTLTTTITNTGNGDATYTFEVVENYEPTLWQITPATSTITVAAGDTRAQAFTVRSDVTFDSGKLDITVGVSELDGSSDSLLMTVVYAEISLSVNQSLAVQRSDNTAEQAVTTLVIPVTNSGERDAINSVIVYARQQGVDEVYQQVTLSVPAGETVDAEFDVGTMTNGNKRFEFYLEVTGDDSDFAVIAEDTRGTGDEPVDFQIRFNIETNTDNNGFGQTVLAGLVIAIVGLVIWGGLNLSRSGSRRF
ncbi:MAG: glycosyltransferase family 39 protein [Candidatus Poseidoniaceae archaeon]|nr:glycosyltransferase family 39 protein [Candidatus Poseidoniaceae archaeon]